MMKLNIKFKIDRGFVILSFGDLATITFEPGDFLRFISECNATAIQLLEPNEHH